jgi:hypothetical protein
MIMMMMIAMRRTTRRRRSKRRRRRITGRGNYSENDDDSGEEEEDEEMHKKPAAREQPVIHNTRPQNKSDKRTYDAVEEPTNKRKKYKRGPTSAKEGTTGGKTPRPVRSKSGKQEYYRVQLLFHGGGHRVEKSLIVSFDVTFYLDES